MKPTRPVTGSLRRSPLLAEIEVVAVGRPSPSFVRVVLGGERLSELGVQGPLLDQRIKLVFPSPGRDVPGLEGDDDSWYQRWLALPQRDRGQMRTYTVRDIRGRGGSTRLVVDLVVHGDPPQGAGAGWAARAEPGERLGLVGPRRGTELGGREFDHGAATDLLLVGDESAVPAIAGILRDLPSTARGVVFAEVPLDADVAALHPLEAPPGMDVRWLPRAGSPVGSRLVPAVRRHLGLGDTPAGPRPAAEPDADDVWETPTRSVAGEDLGQARPPGEHYAWIAGESAVVRTLRRTLVGELGWDRRQVCFMGYWRIGVAMRS